MQKGLSLKVVILLVVEVSPAFGSTSVRYRGQPYSYRPRRDIATESEERVLLEKRTPYMATFDATSVLDHH